MTIFGPDISSFQAGLNLAALTDAAFVIAKTTEGTYYTDGDYDGWRLQAEALHKPFVWYHFLSGEDATAQAAHTAANVGDKSLPGMLDFEPAGSFNPTLAQAVAYIKAAQAAGLRLVLVYLPHWYWQQLGSPDLSELAALGVHLVSSAYPGGTGSATAIYPGDSAYGWQPYGGMTPFLYQFTDQASDGGQSLDYNAFRGTTAQLQQALGGQVILGQDDIDAIAVATAKAVYRYGEETVTIVGPDGKPATIENVGLGHLAHGAHEATVNPNGGLEQMRGQVNQIFHREYPTAAEIAAAIEAHLSGGGSATPAEIAAAVDALLAQKLGA